jgi:hypothetical protein
MDDRQAIARSVGKPGKLGLDALAVAHQGYFKLGLVTHRLDGARDDRTGSKIASHRVQGYPHRFLSRCLGSFPFGIFLSAISDDGMP